MDTKKTNIINPLFTSLPDSSKRDLLANVGRQTGLSEIAVEKDLWITAVLRCVFSLEYAQSFQFKGGTSLSKCWNMMCGKGVDRLVLEDEELFTQIIHHRFIYNRIDGVDYNTETPGHFAIIPPGESLKQWEQDYRNTIAKMIYGAERPGFEAIIARIRKLNEDLNAMKWKEVPVFNPGR